MIYYLTVDGGKFIQYANLKTAKTAGRKAAKETARVVRKRIVGDQEIYETVWVYDVPREVRP